MEKRRLFSLLCITSIMLLGILTAAGITVAQEPVQTPEAAEPTMEAQVPATQEVVATPQPQALAAQQQVPATPTLENCPYGIRSGVAFVWLRTQPSVFAPVAQTVYPGQATFQLYQGLVQWDGVQWWVWASANGGNYNWVELNSLTALCQPSPTPGGSEVANWQPGYIVRVRSTVPFVWFRAAPAPGNAPTYTVLPGAQLIVVQGAVKDSFNQWWWQVRDPRNNMTGWVEQNVVELVSGGPTVTPTPITWQPGNVVRVRPNIAFSWLRNAPSSQAGIVFVAAPRQELVLQAGPQSDGVQNWWNVRLPNAALSGWVEQNSLEYVRPQ